MYILTEAIDVLTMRIGEERLERCSVVCVVAVR